MKNFLFGLFSASFMLFSCRNAPKTDAPVVQAKPVSQTTCYEMRVGAADLTAIELTMNGDEASGFYGWQPDQKDGSLGFFKGKKMGDQIVATYEYYIEGVIETEEIVLKIAGDKLMQGRGELSSDNDGNSTLKDKTKLTFEDVFTTVDCAKNKKLIDDAKEMSANIAQQRAAWTQPALTEAEAKVAANLLGEWQSTSDPKSSIKMANGRYQDIYKGEDPMPALHYIYSPKCPKDCNPIAEMACLKVMGQDDVCFAVVKADGKVLELSQIGGRGNTNKYVKKK